MDDSELDDIIIISDDDFNADVSVSTSVDDGEGILFCQFKARSNVRDWVRFRSA